MEIYRKEHPNPQWERKEWRNLNGEWEFDFDLSKSAKEKKAFEQESLSQKINVPFCPESVLSGIGNTDFMEGVCYKKEIELTEKELEKNIFLHFGAVDYECWVYINGQFVKNHAGGFASFYADITNYAKVGKNVIFVVVEDNLRSKRQPSGKQSQAYTPSGIVYTRTTGIWQTVWLEFVPKSYIKSARYYPDINNRTLTITGEAYGSGEMYAETFYENKSVGKESITVNNGSFSLQIKLSEVHLWEIGNGRLYDLKLKFNDDEVNSYFGMRKVSLDGTKFMLNDKSVFLRLVLDQGFYPDGIYTAKSDEILKNDIVLSQNAGFDGARLHQKIFEPRFLYHCDKMGYVVWSEHGNWGLDCKDAIATGNFLNEWMEEIERDFNHPSIICWCPFNETWDHDEIYHKYRILEAAYRIAKLVDNTRPCIDTSGNFHKYTDIFDVHDYEQNVEKFKGYYAHVDEGIVDDQIRRNEGDVRQKYNGEPLIVSEYGGIGWQESGEEGGGYGNNPKTKEEFYERYKGLTDVLLDNAYICGFCYTQLYDVEGEVNGLYTYERTPKFDIEKIKEINIRKAKIEE